MALDHVTVSSWFMEDGAVSGTVCVCVASYRRRKQKNISEERPSVVCVIAIRLLPELYIYIYGRT